MKVAIQGIVYKSTDLPILFGPKLRGGRDYFSKR